MYAMRHFMFYDTVSHNDLQGLAAIKTRRINLHCFSRKYPADRQGFKTSLCKPFLLFGYGKTILRRLIVEGCK
jgi:hypothetical protein